MQQSSALQGFLEDHRGLQEKARRLGQAIPDGVDRSTGLPIPAARSFLRFWQGKASLHLRKEEEVLLPVLARYQSDVGGLEPVMRMLAGHARRRGLVMQLSDEVLRQDVRLETVSELADRLDAQLRLEEGEVYPLFKKVLSREALDEIPDRLATFEGDRRVEPWVPSWGASYDAWPGPGDSEGGGYDRLTTKKA